MNANIIELAHKFKIPKLFVFSSACAYPTDNYPLTEDMIQDGKPFEGNYAYGYAKRMVDIQVRAYNEQYGHNYCTLVPVSLYGPNDNYSLDNGHFIPALIHKAFLAKNKGEPLSVWGDGSPLRELIYAEDLAHIILRLAEMEKVPHDKYLIGSGVEVSVKQVAEFVAAFMGIKNVAFDTTKANGQLRKPADSSRLRNVIGDYKFTNHEEGLKETIIHFCENYETIRK
jgi:GDP-L-fucose synthase